MTITQHAHIYNFHTSNLCLKKYFFLNFYQCRPYNEGGDGCGEVHGIGDDGGDCKGDGDSDDCGAFSANGGGCIVGNAAMKSTKTKTTT
jgi:hypothetical protein